MQLQTTSPSLESKFSNEYSDVIFIQIDQHLKSYCKNTKGPDFLNHGVCSLCGTDSVLWDLQSQHVESLCAAYKVFARLGFTT